MLRVLVACLFISFVAASPTWPATLTSSLLGQPGFVQHQFVTKSRHPGKDVGSLQTPADYAYWAVNAPFSPPDSLEDYTNGAFCIDAEHSLNRKPHNSTWSNLADINDLIGRLQLIGRDEGDFNAACNQALVERRNEIMDQTVARHDDGSVDVDAQLLATSAEQGFCDVMRVVKYRGALMWLMNNRHNFQGKTPSEYNVAASQLEGCNANNKLSYGNTQKAMWHFIENKESFNPGIPSNARNNECSRMLAHLAMEHNDYMPSCPAGQTSGTHRINAALIIKPNVCTDNNTETRCRQYLVMDNWYELPCEGPTDDGPDDNTVSLTGYVYDDVDCSSSKDESEGAIGALSLSACPCSSEESENCLYNTTHSETGQYQFHVSSAVSSCWNIKLEASSDLYPSSSLSIQAGVCDEVPTGNDEIDRQISGIEFESSASQVACTDFNFGYCHPTPEPTPDPTPEPTPDPTPDPIVCPSCTNGIKYTAPVDAGTTFSSSSSGKTTTLCFNNNA